MNPPQRAPTPPATSPPLRRKPWRLSFRAKTVIGIGLIELLLLGLLVWSSLDFLSRAQVDALAARAQDAASHFAALAQDAVLSEDLASLQTFADEVMTNRDMAFLRVIGYDNPLVVRGAAAAVDRQFAADLPGTAPADGIFDAVEPVMVDGVEFGRIEVGLHAAGDDSMLAAARDRLLGIAGTEILLVALFSILLGTYLTRALERLRDAAETISAGGHGVMVPVRGDDEIAVTVRAFNRMSERLESSYAALERARTAAEDAAAEAEAASAEAHRANAAKSRFLAHMSHELRTPLNAILGSLQLAHDWQLPEDQRRQLTIAEQAGRSLVELINDVLDLSKVEAGELTLTEGTVDVAEVARSAADIVRPLADAKGIGLAANIDHRLPALARLDPLRLRQVLVNLIGNGVKFTDSGEVRLEVATLCPGEPCQRLRFTVSDTGVGIAEEHQTNLFDEFSQVADNRDRQRGGTGLGLAISQRIVNLMGGAIRVDSKPGRGSRFWFEVTVQTVQQPVQIASPAPGSAPACRQPHPDAELPVLVVDDVPTNSAIAGAMLKKAGYDVLTAGNGAEAIEAVCAGTIGCILMDVDMPVMDGVEATRRIRELQGPAGRTPIVAMTAHALAEERERCIGAGMDDFVTKPFAREDMLATVSRWHGATTAPNADMTKTP